MKKFLLAAAVLCMGTMAFAGPNAGGVLNAHDANLLLSATNGSVSVCVQGTTPADYTQVDSEIDGAGGLPVGDGAVFKVYAMFAGPPRLMGITWGVQYDDTNIIPNYYGMCGDFELNDAGWPAPGTGSTVTWNTLQQNLVVPVYYFAAYTYGNPGLFQLIANPTQGAYFGDDSIPAILDPIQCLGALGFEMPGSVCPPGTPVDTGACCDPATGLCTITEEQGCLPPNIWHSDWESCDPNPCPQPQIFGACCNPDTGGCTYVIETECPAPNIWHPEFTGCDPNPCPQPPVPADHSTWGQIKANYR